MALLDFGLVGQVSTKFLEQLTETIFSIYFGDADGVAEGLLLLCEDDREPTKAYRRAVRRYVKTCKHLGFARWFLGAGKIMLDHRLVPPVEFSLLAKFVLVLDGLAERYFPSHSTIDLIGNVIEEAVMERAMRRFSNLSPGAVLLAFSEAASQMPLVLLKAVRRMSS